MLPNRSLPLPGTYNRIINAEDKIHYYYYYYNYTLQTRLLTFPRIYY